jgi:hypothetical protein
MRRRGVAGFGIFTLAMVALLSASGSGSCSAGSRSTRLIAALTERLAAAPEALPRPRSGAR